MEDIIALGLLYKYIGTGIKEIKGDVISSYIAAVNNRLIELGSNYDVHDTNKSFGYSFGLGINEENESYYFTDLDLNTFLCHLAILNADLITASLCSNALSILNVRLEDIPVEKSLRTRTEEIEVSAVNRDDAREKAKNILANRGFIDIKVGNAIPSQSDDSIYKIILSGKFENLEIDINAVNNRIKCYSLEISRDKRRLEISSNCNDLIGLDNLLVADTILMDGNIELERSKRIAFPIDDMTYPQYFADFFRGSIMSFLGCMPLNQDGINIVVCKIEPLDKEMQARYATMEEIEEYVSRINQVGAKKELSPDRR